MQMGEHTHACTYVHISANDLGDAKKKGRLFSSPSSSFPVFVFFSLCHACTGNEEGWSGLVILEEEDENWTCLLWGHEASLVVSWLLGLKGPRQTEENM